MSGISILRNLLLKQAVKESGQASGIMSIGDSVRKLVERRLQSYLVSAANKGIDLDKFSESQIKYMLEMNDPYNKAKMSLKKEQGIKSADVFDLKGRKLDKDKPIIGGTQQTKEEGLERVTKTLQANQERKLNLFKNLDDNKKLNNDEYEEFLDEIGGPDRLEAYEFDGTAGSAKRILKQDVEYEQSMFNQYKKEKLNPETTTSSDNEITQAYNKAVKEGKLENVRLKDGRKIESEEDFRNYIDELNEDNNLATGGRAGFKSGSYLFTGLKDLGKKYKGSTLEAILENPKILGTEIGYEGIAEILRLSGMMQDGGRVGLKDGFPSKEENLRLLKEELKEIFRKQTDPFPKPGGKKFKDFKLGLENILSKSRPKNAGGGRVGLKAGMSRRAFLKLIGGVGAGIGALKSGILKLAGKEAAPQVAKEVVQQTTKSTPPPYFFELANKIKSLGKPDKVTYADRVEIHRYTGKNGDEYELVEDLSTGDMKITKDKLGSAGSGEEMYEGVMDRSVMEYKKGDVNVDPDQKIASKAPDEYDEYKIEFDVDGTEADADNMSEFIRKEIIEEANQQAPKIKKAGGGVAYMLGE